MDVTCAKAAQVNSTTFSGRITDLTEQKEYLVPEALTVAQQVAQVAPLRNGMLQWVTDATGGAVLAVSVVNGAALEWRRVHDNALIS